MFEFGVGNLCLKPAVVGQQQQPLAVGVEPSGGVEAGKIDKVFEAFVFFVR